MGMEEDCDSHDLLHSVVKFLLKVKDPIHLSLLGTQPLQDAFAKIAHNQENVDFVLSDDPIRMDENPLFAVRRKKNSSLCKGMRLLKENKINAFISNGNTGALMSSAKMYLSTFKRILRPALLALMPTKKKPMAVLDVGANISYKVEHLLQFALLGISHQRARGVQNPKVGLLNIGRESIKGTSVLQKTYKELEQSSKEMGFTFLGNIEGKESFEGELDVLVTDGFTGNIFLKTAEGMANLVLDRIQENIFKKEDQDHLQNLQKHLHYAEYPGALLIGVKGIVVKCHGYSTPATIINGIQDAKEMVQNQFLKKIENSLSQLCP